jgi:hypothetical protein
MIHTECSRDKVISISKPDTLPITAYALALRFSFSIFPSCYIKFFPSRNSKILFINGFQVHLFLIYPPAQKNLYIVGSKRHFLMSM